MPQDFEFIYQFDRRFLAVAVFAATWVVFAFLRKTLLKKLEKTAHLTASIVDDIVVEILKETKTLSFVLVSAFAASHFFELPEKIGEFAKQLFIVLVFIQVALWGSSAIQVCLESWMKERVSKDPSQGTSFGLISVGVKTIFYVTVVLLALNNLGVNITALVAGLGVGGIAVALAVQNILSDLFASLTIVLDKPFVVGDSISLGEWSGTVEHIGLKTTRVRSVTGEQVIFGNADLLSSRLRNFKRMSERRVLFQIGVTYQTEKKHLEQIPDIIKKIINEHPSARFERAHFFRLGNSSLDYEIVYWILSADYNVHMDTQQSILLKLYNQFNDLKVEFAYPTQTVFINKT